MTSAGDLYYEDQYRQAEVCVVGLLIGCQREAAFRDRPPRTLARWNEMSDKFGVLTSQKAVEPCSHNIG